MFTKQKLIYSIAKEMYRQKSEFYQTIKLLVKNCLDQFNVVLGEGENLSSSFFDSKTPLAAFMYNFLRWTIPHRTGLECRNQRRAWSFERWSRRAAFRRRWHQSIAKVSFHFKHFICIFHLLMKLLILRRFSRV